MYRSLVLIGWGKSCTLVAYHLVWYVILPILSAQTRRNKHINISYHGADAMCVRKRELNARLLMIFFLNFIFILQSNPIKSNSLLKTLSITLSSTHLFVLITLMILSCKFRCVINNITVNHFSYSDTFFEFTTNNLV